MFDPADLVTLNLLSEPDLISDFARSQENLKTLTASIDEKMADQTIATVKVELSMVRCSEGLLLNYSNAWGVEGSKPEWICSNLAISNGDQHLSVPLSAYCDLADIEKISLERVGNSFTLIIRGGETGSGYLGKVYFDSCVRRREISLRTFPDEVWQTTIYNFNELNN